MLNTENKPEKSKSQVKRELLALQKLGKELVDLSSRDLHQLPLSDPIREAILQAKPLKREALRRQLKHIGKLMRDEDAEAIQAALAALRQPRAEETKRLHEVEAWRDALLAGDETLLDQLCLRFPGIDRQHFRQLARNARKEQALNKPPRAARVLFRDLKDLPNNEYDE